MKTSSTLNDRMNVEVIIMDNNMQTIEFLINYIEEHINEDITLESLADVAGYSKYHLHRMFTSLVGFSVHQYVIRRKLTESAKKLLFSDLPILEIALDAGYESQQSYTYAFKGLYKMTPKAFRKKHEFRPIQLKFDMSGNLTKLKGDRIMDIQLIEREEMCFVGFKGNTKRGFFVIPRLWQKLHREKNRINNRVNPDFLIGINDYSKDCKFEEGHYTFDYYAAVEVTKPEELSAKMSVISLPAGKYVAFTYQGKSKDSVQPVMDYIYKEWFPYSTCQLNEDVRLDFVRYGEKTNEKGQNQIEVWIPIL